MKQLLTSQQIAEWRDRVHQEYLKADTAYKRAVMKERLFKRYLYRYIEEQDKDANTTKR